MRLKGWESQMDKLLKIGFLACLVILAWMFVVYSPDTPSSENKQPELPPGTYTIPSDTLAANSLDNLVQMDECIKRDDRQCEDAMLLDEREYALEKGTVVDGSEVGYEVFSGQVRSGALVGKNVFLHASVLKVGNRSGPSFHPNGTTILAGAIVCPDSVDARWSVLFSRLWQM
jgi:hypothetical protein